MTDYEIITVVIEIFGLMISTSILMIALLTFLDSRNKKQ